MNPPPLHEPLTLAFEWFADPFNPLLRRPADNGKLWHTPLGALVESYAWIKRHGTPVPCGEIAALMRSVLRRECPEILHEVERLLYAETPSR